MANEIINTPPEGQLLFYQDSQLKIQVRIDGQTVWLTQRHMAELYQVSVKTVNEHLTNIYAEGELDQGATIRRIRIVQTEGTNQATVLAKRHNHDAIVVKVKGLGYGE